MVGKHEQIDRILFNAFFVNGTDRWWCTGVALRVGRLGVAEIVQGTRRHGLELARDRADVALEPLFDREHGFGVFLLDRPVERLPELAVAPVAGTALVATDNVESVRVSSIHEPIPAVLARLLVAQRRSLVAWSTATRDAAEVERDAYRHGSFVACRGVHPWV